MPFYQKLPITKKPEICKKFFWLPAFVFLDLESEGNGIGFSSVFIDLKIFDELLCLKVFKKLNNNIASVAFFIAASVCEAACF